MPSVSFPRKTLHRTRVIIEVPPIPAEGFGLGDHPLHPLRPADFHPPRQLRSQQGLTRPAEPAPHVTSGCVRAQLP